jgi:hypothetical protein
MPAEIPNQLQSGSPYTERELFSRLLHDLGNCHTDARGLAALRKDLRWLAVAGLFEELREKATLLMTKPQGIVIPKSYKGL